MSCPSAASDYGTCGTKLFGQQEAGGVIIRPFCSYLLSVGEEEAAATGIPANTKGRCQHTMEMGVQDPVELTLALIFRSLLDSVEQLHIDVMGL